MGLQSKTIHFLTFKELYISSTKEKRKAMSDRKHTVIGLRTDKKNNEKKE